MGDKLNQIEVKSFYENVNNAWPSNNKWHNINQKEINNYVKKIKFKKNDVILNAGSGENTYGLQQEMYHIDIVNHKNRTFKHFYQGSIEQMPFADSFFDVAICVGSVLNYCDALKAISELSRVLKSNGVLILEFENSYSFEYKDSSAYKKSATVITTSYFDKPHKMWIFSPKYIIDILKVYDLQITKKYSYHILSSMIYNKTKNENKAAKYALFDKILRHIPIIKMHSGNIIFCCIKK